MSFCFRETLREKQKMEIAKCKKCQTKEILKKSTNWSSLSSDYTDTMHFGPHHLAAKRLQTEIRCRLSDIWQIERTK